MTEFQPRYAIYYTPPPDSRFAQFGAGLLGYDPFEGVTVERSHSEALTAKTLERITAEPRRYGFHATLVAPFHPKEASEADLLAALDAFARDHPPVEIGSLTMTQIGDFLALTPADSVSALDRVESGLVRLFDEFRATSTEADRARRLTAHLSPRQRELFARWGYPFGLDQFRFHMTLTGPLAPAELPKVRSALSEFFEEVVSTRLEIDALSLMRQDRPDTRFVVLSRVKLKGRVLA